VTTTLAITMAGRGQRFRDAGYDVPKFQVVVRGQPLFRWAIESLRSWTAAGAHLVFIAREEDRSRDFIAGECAAQDISSFEVLTLTGTTDGQATTALLARDLVSDAGAPFAVYNVDTHVRPGALREQDARGDGWVPCFPGAGSAWSFARTGPDGRVEEMREKERISPHATVGLYWFRSFELYADLYERHFASSDGGVEAGERYIAPMYNTLIRDGGSVYIQELDIDDVVPLGTPAEVERFAAAAG
jgi:dTDP-glucose pyrophosphorylase